ncbi:hypothetical protein, partial [Caldifermentibacillus hisashii]|uniref:hypothetical protein n=1 Tax=Caldifermentibacillus hisashii TaxID=996558 RepID=UPI002DFA1ECF|nr:hypothetical protein [Caldifermentibacillus hisashii]
NPIKKSTHTHIEASKSYSMGQNRNKTTKKCPIERRYGTKCIEKREKVSHRSKQILFYGTKPQQNHKKVSHRKPLWDKMH